MKRPSVMDGYASIVDRWLAEDLGNWHKQPHTAKRVWRRVRDERGVEVSYNTVQRCIKSWRAAHCAVSDCFFDQTAVTADMQVDFGRAESYLCDVRMFRLL